MCSIFANNPMFNSQHHTVGVGWGVQAGGHLYDHLRRKKMFTLIIIGLNLDVLIILYLLVAWFCVFPGSCGGSAQCFY